MIVSIFHKVIIQVKSTREVYLHKQFDLIAIQ